MEPLRSEVVPVVIDRETGTELPWAMFIDPGNTESAFVAFDAPLHGGKICSFGKQTNEWMIARLRELRADSGPSDHVAIEMIASYGMPVGKEVFDTCVWIGRFIEAWGGPYTLVYRREVKMFLCGNNTAKDGNIRQALIDRYGGKVAAIGNKKSPGPLYGISADVWSALAVAVTWQNTHGRAA